MEIFQPLIHWLDQPEIESYINGAFGLVVAGAIYVLTPILTKFFATGRLFDDVILSGDQVIYRGTIMGGTGRVGFYYCNTKIGILDAQSGKVIRKRTLDADEYKIHFIADGKIWTASEKMEVNHILREFRIKVLDLNTLKTVHDNKSIQKHFHFKAGERLTNMKADSTNTKIIFWSNTGKYAFDISTTALTNLAEHRHGVYKNILISRSTEGQTIGARDAATGKVVWRKSFR